jgi:hypothetical protein
MKGILAVLFLKGSWTYFKSQLVSGTAVGAQDYALSHKWETFILNIERSESELVREATLSLPCLFFLFCLPPSKSLQMLPAHARLLRGASKCCRLMPDCYLRVYLFTHDWFRGWRIATATFSFRLDIKPPSAWMQPLKMIIYQSNFYKIRKGKINLAAWDPPGQIRTTWSSIEAI